MIPLCGIAAYANSCSGPFIFDDLDAVVRNSSIKSFAAALWPPRDLPVSGRPVVSLLFALNYAIGGYQVFGYHVLNIALHVLCGLTLYGLVRRTFEISKFPEQDSARVPLSLLITLLWLLHPLQTEAVTYITQRTELTVSLFLLLTLYSLARSFQTSGTGESRRWQIFALVSCALGMLSKEVMVVAPLLALLYDRAFLAKSFRKAFATRWPLHLALWATLLILAVILVTNPRGKSVSQEFKELTPFQYLLMQLEIVPLYLRLSFWPNPLVLDYDDWPIRTSIAQVWQPALVLLTLAAVGLYAFLRNWRSGFLAAAFFAILAPTSSVLVIASEVAAERRMYLPLATVISLVVVGLWRLAERTAASPAAIAARHRLVFPLLGALCVALGIASFRRNAAYASDDDIWSDALSKRPNNTRAMLHLATFHRDNGEAARKQGDQEAARRHRDQAYDFVLRAIALMPNNGFAHHILADLLLKDGRRSEALVHFLETVRYRPTESDAQSMAIVLLTESGRTAEARAQIDQALIYNPGNYVALRSLGILQAQGGDVRNALSTFDRSLRAAGSQSQQIEARMNLATAFLQLNETGPAAAQLNEVLRMDPQNAEARRALGRITGPNAP